MDSTKKIFYASLSVMILTIVHHVYGAIVYDTPFRLHIAYIALPVIVLYILLYQLSVKLNNRGLGRLCFNIFLVSAIIFSVAIIGLYEGGFNHLIKNVLYFSGASSATFAKLYSPPPVFVLPDNFIFEFTGIAQLILGVYTLITITHHLSKQKKRTTPAAG